jgi:hypothetical protein
MVNQKGHPESLGVTRLNEGEASRPIRIRAPATVLEQLEGRGAAAIGELLTLAVRHERALRALAEKPRRKLKQPPPFPPYVPFDKTVDVDLEGITKLQVVRTEFSPATKTALGWRPQHYLTRSRQLAVGPTITLVHRPGKQSVWLTASGEVIRADTLKALMRVGILKPEI